MTLENVTDFPHPFISNGFKGTIKRTAETNGLRNQSIGALDLHPTLEVQILNGIVTERRAMSNTTVYKPFVHFTFNSSDGHNTKLMMAPP